jgi:hypothetical protein
MRNLAEKVHSDVQRLFTYKSDKEQFQDFWDHWKSWADEVEANQLFSDDCVWVEEEVFAKDGVKKIKDLVVGDMVLSYDFVTQVFVYKPVIMVMDKGLLPCKEITLKNNYTIIITEDHLLWVRTNQGQVHGKKVSSKYEKRKFSDIDLTRWWKRKLPIAKKIPYKIIDIEWLSEDICFLLGHILAEGWTTEHDRYYTSGREIDEYIIPILDSNNIPYARHTNNSDVPYITFYKSTFREYLREMVFNSFDIRVPEEIFHLPPNKIQKFMDGYFLGDGHFEGKDKSRKCYSTSCQEFAKNLQRMALQCGYSLNGYKQECHQGVGTKPIWRVQHDLMARYHNDYGYSDISETSINKHKIKDVGLLPVRDFTVADTHTFVFKNGLIAHQCDGFCLTCAELLIRQGAKPEDVTICDVSTETGGRHLVCVYGSWVLDNRYHYVPYWNDLDYEWHRSMRMDEPGTWRKL